MENITLFNEPNTILVSDTLKIYYGITSISAQVIAFFSYFGFIHYEFFGGDPMKR